MLSFLTENRIVTYYRLFNFNLVENWEIFDITNFDIGCVDNWTHNLKCTGSLLKEPTQSWIPWIWSWGLKCLLTCPIEVWRTLVIRWSSDSSGSGRTRFCRSDIISKFCCAFMVFGGDCFFFFFKFSSKSITSYFS